ncbi:hypothetical protein [Gimesia algae]|uniref:Uncharacterized protein n=1 Tax=Gimesia algae TaxID=2527971 RepID=A0A517VGG1_9PLAN|nr:hypothetical protein [Gimesia algae]QDT92106.1 hypothetical protein Pan161_37720 [Gimesia algae]
MAGIAYIGIFIGLMIVLLIITIVGHGIWVFVATLIRASSVLNSISDEARITPSTESPLENTFNQDRQIAQRYLRRLYYEGKIPEQEFQKLLQYTTEEFISPPPLQPVEAPQQTDSVSKTKTEAPAPAPVEPDTTPAEISDFLDESDFLEESTIQSRPEKFTAPTAESHQPSGISEPPTEKRAIGSLLNAFMEDKNIRWGELVSGLLIVGSAIGLVVSLWSTLKNQIPYLPALLFLLATAAIHGAGLYTFKRWKLESTSRGLLLITVLLVPLNFLAGIRLSDHRPATDPLFILAIGIGFAAFGWMVSSASRILVSFGRLPLLAMVLGTSAGQLIISRVASSNPSFLQTNLLALLPAGCFIIGMALILKQTLKWEEVTDSRARELVTLGGLAVFAVLAPCWLLVWNTTNRLETFSCLTPLFSLMEILLLGLGLVLHHRKNGDETPHWALTGSSIAILAGLMILINFAISWPRVDILIVLGIVNCISLSILAIQARFALCHIPALISAAIAGLLGFHLLTGTIAWEGTTQSALIESLLLGRSSIVFAVFTILTTSGALFLRQTGKQEDARYFLYTAGCFSILSTVIAAYAGFVTQTDLNWTTLALLMNTIFCLLANWYVRKMSLSGIASFLGFLTLQHALCLNSTIRDGLSHIKLLPDGPFVWGCFIHATTGLLFLMGLHFWCRSRNPTQPAWSLIPVKSNHFTRPMIVGSVCTSLLMIPYVLLQNLSAEMHAFYSFWLMLIWISVALILKSDRWFLCSQFAGTAGSLYSATAIGMRYRLWEGDGFEHPRYWLIHILAVVIWILVGSAIHSKKYSRNMLGALSRSARLNLQPTLLAGSIIATGFVLCGALFPAMLTQLKDSYAISAIHRLAIPFLAAFFIYIMVLIGVVLARPKPQRLYTLPGLMMALLLLIIVSNINGFDQYLPLFSFQLKFASEAFSYWSWICLGLLIVACLPYLNSRFQSGTALGVLFITYLIPFLIAGYFIEQNRAADVLRWGLSLYSLALMLLIINSESLLNYLRAKEIQLRYLPRLLADKPTWRNLSILGACLPLLVLTTFQIFGYWLEFSRDPHSVAFSERIIPMLGFCMPLVLLLVAMICYAIHFRSAGWMQIGSHLLALVVITGTIMSFSESLTAFESAAWLRTSILTGLAFSLYGLCWLKLEPKINAEFKAHQALSPVNWPLIRIHAITMLCLIVGPYLLPFLMNLANPQPEWEIYFPQIPRTVILSLSLATGFLWWFSRRYASSLFTNGMTFLSFALIGFVTILLRQHSDTPAWRINFLMEAGLILVGSFHTLCFLLKHRLINQTSDSQSSASRHFYWSQILVVTLFLFAFRGAWTDALRPLPAITIAGCGTLVYFLLGICLRKDFLKYTSLTTALMGTLFFVTANWNIQSSSVSAQQVFDLIKWLTTTAAIIAGCWLSIDLYLLKSSDSESKPVEHPALQQIISRILTCVILFYTLLVAVTRTLLSQTDIPLIRDTAGWTTLLAVTLLLIGLLWDPKSRYALQGLFIIGICYIGTFLSTATELRLLAQHSGLAVSCYACLIGVLWRLRGVWMQLTHNLRMPEQLQQSWRWLPSAITVLSVYAILSLLHSVLRFEEVSLRWWSVVGTLITGFAFYAFSDHNEFSLKFKKRTLLATGIGFIYAGWALLPVKDNFYWINHLIRLLEVVAILSLLLTVIQVQWKSLTADWSEAVRTNSRTFLTAAGFTLFSILITEVRFHYYGISLQLTPARIGVVSLTLVALSAALVLMAAIPKYDPFQLTLKRRMWYVYAAEIVLALLFLHIYLTMPELFRGYLLPYWPYIVIAIAFAGAGVGEFFDRIGLNVLSEPLQRTGTFLPLLPALSFWIHAVAHEQSPIAGDYSMILLLIGIVYVTMSLWRKSFIYTTLAALAGNGALWAFWMEQGQVFSHHPQLWLIPPALSVLIATHLNRDKLNTTQLTAIRYFATMSIYISSTGDMFIAGVANSLWPPVILCSLSVLGVFAGMMFRVRAFLYAGSSFLVLSIVSMIWHASQSLGHVWPWWAFGIGLGICILTLFGMFEKRRNEMLELVGQLKTWER